MMDIKQLIKVILTSLVIALLASTGAAFPAPSRKYTIRIDKVGVTFAVPRGFIVLQNDNKHHLWGTTISFGEEFRPGHLTSAPVRLVFWPAGFDGTKTVAEYTPSQYVDAEFKRVKEALRQRIPGFQWEPEYVKLLGNRAVRYTFQGLDVYTVILGYLRGDQVPRSMYSQEYLVRIDISARIESELYKQLVDPVVNSLRTIP